MKINITAGDKLNEILQTLFPAELFVPFREAMNVGAYTAPLFSHDFMLERCRVHGVSRAEYEDKLRPFVAVLTDIDKYTEIVLWFGNDACCLANRTVVQQALHLVGYAGTLTLHTVNEYTGEILQTSTIQQ